jgi:acetyltransferase
LAIRPYPEEYVCSAHLRDGTSVLLRPIQSEDEPLWHQCLAQCSAQSIKMRFRYLFKQSTHEMATRFCFVDYDRTMAIAAVIQETGAAPQLIGVGRLESDADHRCAEYAVLVVDTWQKRGVGSLLTDYCFQICGTWGINRLLAETTSDNYRMRRLLTNRGFHRKMSKEAIGNDLLFEKLLTASKAVQLPVAPLGLSFDTPALRG